MLLGWITTNMGFVVLVFLLCFALLVAGSMAFLTWTIKDEADKFKYMQLFFAMGILTGLGLILAFAITAYVWGPQHQGTESPGKTVFDACVKVIPPIITLVLGTYFGTTMKGGAEAEKPVQKPVQKPEQASTSKDDTNSGRDSSLSKIKNKGWETAPLLECSGEPPGDQRRCGTTPGALPGGNSMTTNGQDGFGRLRRFRVKSLSQNNGHCFRMTVKNCP